MNYSLAMSKTTYRDVLTNFFNEFSNDSLTFVDCFIVEEQEVVTRYRYKKGRLYEDNFTFKDIDDTIIEEMMINPKEQYIYQPQLFLDIKSKKNYVGNMLYVKPIIVDNQVHGLLSLHLTETVDNISDLVTLAQKLLMLKANLKVTKELSRLKIVLNNEDINLFKVSELSSKIKKLFINDNLEDPVKIKEKLYKMYKLNSTYGYLVNVSNEESLKHEKEEAYRDRNTSLNSFNKFLKEYSDNSSVTVIEIQFATSYIYDVVKALKGINNIYQTENGIYIVLDSHDKRKLKSQLNVIKNMLSKVKTLKYLVGVLRVGKDVKNFNKELLNSITKSNTEFYDKELFKTEIYNINRKQIAYNQLKQATYEHKRLNIMSLNNHLVAHYFPLVDRFDDNRMELLKLIDLLNEVMSYKDSIPLMIEISDELLESYNMVEELEKYKLTSKLYSKLTFVFNKKHSSFEMYLHEKNVKIGRKSFEEVVSRKIGADYLFLDVPYERTSNYLLELLSKYQNDSIVMPIFRVKDRSDLMYLIDNQVGYVYQNK